MDRRKKVIRIILWTLVILCILLFVVIIVVEYSLSRNATSVVLEYATFMINNPHYLTLS